VNEVDARGIYVRQDEIADDYAPPQLPPAFELASYHISGYRVISRWVFLKEEIFQSKDMANNSSTISKKYLYGNYQHQQPTRIETSQSDGTSFIEDRYYPLDFTSISTGAIAKMKGDAHMHSTVIEKVKKIKRAGQETVLNAHFVKFEEIALNPPGLGSLILPTETYDTEARNGVTGFVNAVNSGTPNPSWYQLQASYAYNDLGQIKKVTDKTGGVNSYLWGYNARNIIAEIKNAEPQHVFYTSFEFETANTSTVAKTGRVSSTSALTVTPPTAGDFKFTYWRKNGAMDWELVEDIISTPRTIGGGGLLIDEVRLVPVHAQMTTVTYDVGYGTTDMTDPNNSVTYYNYDKLGRLINTKDHDSNLLSTYNYHYANQN
jgi:YD repeat-containing protein